MGHRTVLEGQKNGFIKRENVPKHDLEGEGFQFWGTHITTKNEIPGGREKEMGEKVRGKKRGKK